MVSAGGTGQMATTNPIDECGKLGENARSPAVRHAEADDAGGNAGLRSTPGPDRRPAAQPDQMPRARPLPVTGPRPDARTPLMPAGQPAGPASAPQRRHAA